MPIASNAVINIAKKIVINALISPILALTIISINNPAANKHNEPISFVILVCKKSKKLVSC